MLKIKSLKEGLPQALKQSEISAAELQSFYSTLTTLFSKDYKASNEEKAKNYINKFLTAIGYNIELNIGDDIGGGIDIAILSKESRKVNVIIETKAYGGDEMISDVKANKKALHEAVRYYLYQRVVEKNLETKRILITDYDNWYFFDSSEFYRLFIKNASFKSKYEKWRNKKYDGNDVNVFYNDIVKKYLDQEGISVNCLKFSVSDYEFVGKPFTELNRQQLTSIKNLYHIFSANFLLKEFRESDNNKLNEDFYKELLHIIGLKQEEKNGKYIIVRRDQKETDSLIGNTISSFKDEIHSFPLRNDYGATDKQIEFNIALELCLTWVNRTLFLKLLEAQLLSYHNGDKKYKFLDYKKEWSYHELYKLFFKVLAKRVEERDETINSKYHVVPYLNSSLFNYTLLEAEIGSIKGLEHSKSILVYSKTKLKDSNGNTLSGKLDTLTYFFRFLSAYDFTADQGSGGNENLISASVLGLIFEKINGYEEGAVFTPSTITMMMCRNTLQRLVVSKFNKHFGWQCSSFDDLKDELNSYIKSNKSNKAQIRKEANELINSLKICDIAVGSGHFLVSALNELISIKSELQILHFNNNPSYLLPYDVDVVNDELVILNIDDIPFKYTPSNEDSQKVQETLFHEKQTIIENCLFGVDINKKSVQICQLRLWIELLKNAYYTKESGFTQLETLPNIDINIKQGNSLLYRFDFNTNWDELDNASDKKVNIDDYRNAVIDYKHNKGEKETVKLRIEEFKSNLRNTFSLHDVSNKKLKLVREYISACTLQTATLFDTDDNYLQLVVLNKLKDLNAKPKKGQVLINNSDWNKIGLSREKLKERNLLPSLKRLEKAYESEVKEKENSVLYRNAFEWRIEFPEVLDSEGNFKGFDAIIANPPYMRVQTIARNQPKLQQLYEQMYSVARGSYEFANLFIELALKLSAPDAENTFILPHKFLNSKNGQYLRDYLMQVRSIHTMVHFGANRVFKDADTFTCIIQFNKQAYDRISFYRTPYRADWSVEMKNEDNYQFIEYKDIIKINRWYGGNQWHLLDNKKEYQLLEHMYDGSTTVSKICKEIFQGVATSKDSLYIVDLLRENTNTYSIYVPLDEKTIEVEKALFKPLLRGIDTQRYSTPNSKKLLFFPYLTSGGNDIRNAEEALITEEELKQYPLTYRDYVKAYEEEFKKRENRKAEGMNKWWGYIYPKSIHKFEQTKLSSMEIATVYPNIILDSQCFYHPTTVYSWILEDDAHCSYSTLIGIANSKLLWWFLKRTGDTLKDDARRFKTNYLNPFPIPKHLDLVTVALLEQKVEERQKKKQADAQLKLDREIDSIVYQLYSLEPEEIQIVEEGAAWGWEKVG